MMHDRLRGHCVFAIRASWMFFKLVRETELDYLILLCSYTTYYIFRFNNIIIIIIYIALFLNDSTALYSYSNNNNKIIKK